MSPEPIDLHHLERERIIASYLLDTDDGPAIFDCGPSSTIDGLKGGLADRGLALTDVRHLLLSHIHLDHAGAAGVLVREHPELQVHVSPIGAPHLVDPERLERSARRLYGDSFDSLWGELAPVPQENVHPLDGPVLGLESFPTPGHASHHVCFLDPDGTLYAGDACGVRVLPGRFVMPPTPPPEVDVEAWEQTLDEIERRAPERLALVHSTRGLHHEAEQLAREAVDYSLRTDSPWQQGNAFYDLGQVLEAAGRLEEAAAAYEDALDRYEQKGIIPLARRVRQRLAELQPA